MKISELHMDSLEMVNAMKAIILALDEAIDYDKLREGAFQRLGEITEDQRTGLEMLFSEIKEVKLTERSVDEVLAAFEAEQLAQEMLADEEADEPEEDTAE